MAKRDRSDFSDEVVGDLVSVVVPFGQSTGSRLFSLVRQEWRRNASISIKSAVRASGMKREDLEEFVATSPELVPLYVQLLMASGTNGHDETLRAMGAVFGKAADAVRQGQPEGLADAARALRAMADLDVQHFVALRAVLQHAQQFNVQPGTGGLTPKDAADRTGMSSGTAEQCFHNLASAGLIYVNNTWMGLFYAPTPLAFAVEQAARAVGDEG